MVWLNGVAPVRLSRSVNPSNSLSEVFMREQGQRILLPRTDSTHINIIASASVGLYRIWKCTLFLCFGTREKDGLYSCFANYCEYLISSLHISHELEDVDCPSSGHQQVFLCHKWLGDDEGDQLIERDLYESEDMRLTWRPSMENTKLSIGLT